MTDAKPSVAEPSVAKPIVAVLDVMPETSLEVVRQYFAPTFEVRCATGQPGELADLAGSATVLLTMWGKVDASLIAEARNCRVIQKLGVGIDRIDIEAAKDHRIAVLRAAGINADAVAELTVLLTLAVSRRLLWAAESVRAGRFDKEVIRATTFQLTGKTVGMVGFGHIGQAAARRFSAFGAIVRYHDVRRVDAAIEAATGARYLPLDELISTSQVISLHLPSTPETRGLLGKEMLSRVQPGAIVVNTARGDLIDEDALVEALRSGRLRGVGLDVTPREPLPPDSALWDLDGVVITPHIGGAVGDNFPRVIERAFRNVSEVLEGRPAPNPEDVVVAADTDRQ
jgi:phosphoglycerate dehydrogenase-like enzyme